MHFNHLERIYYSFRWYKIYKKMIEHNYYYHTLSNRDTSIFTMNANIERNVYEF